jgi:hypothetical protein
MRQPHVLDGSRRFPASTARIALLGLFTSLLYLAGLATGGYAGHLSLEAVRASQSVPILPWVAAFAFMVSGMLAVVYGFFFRPRAVEINSEEMALVRWDGKGPSIRRVEVGSVEAGPYRITLRAGSRTLSLTRIYSDWDGLREALRAWKPTPAQS